MGRYFSDVVEQAIADLYYCYDIERAKAASEALFHAAKERQDGDACYLLGWGCKQNIELGQALLKRSRSSRYKSYGLGIMYAEGIGVPEGIELGVEYLKAAGNYGPALDALKNYKKSFFFGTWRRR